MNRAPMFACVLALVACEGTAPPKAPQPLSHRAPQQAVRRVADDGSRAESLPGEPLPAGCWMWAYLRQECEGVALPRFAVVLAVTSDVTAAEAALHDAQGLHLPAGYPFAATLDQLHPLVPAPAGPSPEIAVVAGVFAQKADADAYRAALAGKAETLALAPPADPRFVNFAPTVVVELREDAPAWSRADLEELENGLDEALAAHWVKLPAQEKRRALALATRKPRCTVPRGRLFVTTSEDGPYSMQRQYAPVRCDDGTDAGAEAWVRWRTTALETVVTRGAEPDAEAEVHQVVLVECDQATIETRRWSAPSTEPLHLALAGPC